MEGATGALRDDTLSRIGIEIARRTGLTGLDALGSHLSDTVRTRRAALGLGSDAAYHRFLVAGDSRLEWQQLIENVSIGETSFWRYPEQWNALRRTVLPDLGSGLDGRPLRVWCAGCSTGAEPYSLSILLRRVAPELWPSGGVEILATDISEERLAVARRALYSDWDLRALPGDLRSACFAREERHWRLEDTLKAGITFRRQNLVSFAEDADPHGLFDLVICRNVMIYFAPDLVGRLLDRFRTVLREGGWFVTGHAEPYLEIARVFEAVPLDRVTLFRHAPSARSAATAPRPRTARFAHGLIRKSPDAPEPSVEAPAVLQERSAPAVPDASPGSPHRRTEAGGAEGGSHPTPAIASVWQRIEQGDRRGARLLLTELTESDPLIPEVHFLTALVAVGDGDRAAAECALQRALYLDPDFALAHYQRGLLARSSAREVDAERSFRNVLASLAPAGDDAVVRAGEGLSSGDLRHLARLQLGLGPEPGP